MHHCQIGHSQKHRRQNVGQASIQQYHLYLVSVILNLKPCLLKCVYGNLSHK
jgi:hypothetical protein